MLIRKAENKDIPALQALLKQVGNVHHEGRPDLFLPDTCKYNEQELRQLLACDKTPVFVAVEQDEVCGYAFCQLTKSHGNGAFVEHKALYLDFWKPAAGRALEKHCTSMCFNLQRGRGATTSR